MVSGEYYEPVGVAEELTQGPFAVEVGGEKFAASGAEATAAGREMGKSYGSGRRRSWKGMRFEMEGEVGERS